MISELHIVYDDDCGFCTEVARWLSVQPQRISLTLVPRSSQYGKTLSEQIRADDELVAVDNLGGAYTGDSAFVMTLWALEGFEKLAYRFGSPTFRPYVRRLFHHLSRHRATLSAWLGLATQNDNALGAHVSMLQEPARCVRSV